jgi:TonB family protein
MPRTEDAPAARERDAPATVVAGGQTPVEGSRSRSVRSWNEPDRAGGEAAPAESVRAAARERDVAPTGGAPTGSGRRDDSGRGGAGDTGGRNRSSSGSSGVGGGAEGGGPRGNGSAPGLALAPGPPAGGAEAEDDGYLEAVRRRIQESLTYPEAARRRSVTGVVKIEITVQPNGKIGEATIVMSSSHPVLDDAALDTVRSLGRVPFPPGIRPRTLRAVLPVVFEIH